jgi:hypothetical protein
VSRGTRAATAAAHLAGRDGRGASGFAPSVGAVLLGVFHNIWDWTAVGTLALAVVGAVALIVAGLTLRQTKEEMVVSRRQIEEAHRPLIIPLKDLREINLATPSGIEKLSAVPRTDSAGAVEDHPSRQTRLLIPIENLGTGPAIQLAANVTVDSSEEPSADQIPGLRADGRLFLVFTLQSGDGSRLQVPSYKLSVAYQDIAGKQWVTEARYIAEEERYESPTFYSVASHAGRA